MSVIDLYLSFYQPANFSFFLTDKQTSWEQIRTYNIDVCVIIKQIVPTCAPAICRLAYGELGYSGCPVAEAYGLWEGLTCRGVN